MALWLVEASVQKFKELKKLRVVYFSDYDDIPTLEIFNKEVYSLLEDEDMVRMRKDCRGSLHARPIHPR